MVDWKESEKYLCLASSLSSYHPSDPWELSCRERMIDFLNSQDDCLCASCLLGHFTASAWVVDLSAAKILLLWHKKLNKWLQPGGHIEGDDSLLAAAAREAVEETGLALEPVSKDIFDIDIHQIPPHKGLPAHFHFDVRFAFQTKTEAEVSISSESLKFLWSSLSEIEQYTSEESILRMARKTHVASK